MSYRPQFAYKSPADCEEQRCVYSFDATNTPWLATTLAGGATIQRIPLLLDKDADFYLRGIQTPDVGISGNLPGLEFRLEDANGHPLSDTENAAAEINYQYAGLYSTMDGAGIVVQDSDDWGVFCQAGSKLYLYLYNPTVSPIALTTFIVNLHGVKRYSGERCAA